MRTTILSNNDSRNSLAYGSQGIRDFVDAAIGVTVGINKAGRQDLPVAVNYCFALASLQLTDISDLSVADPHVRRSALRP